MFKQYKKGKKKPLRVDRVSELLQIGVHICQRGASRLKTGPLEFHLQVWTISIYTSVDLQQKISKRYILSTKAAPLVHDPSHEPIAQGTKGWGPRGDVGSSHNRWQDARKCSCSKFFFSSFFSSLVESCTSTTLQGVRISSCWVEGKRESEITRREGANELFREFTYCVFFFVCESLRGVCTGMYVLVQQETIGPCQVSSPNSINIKRLSKVPC